MLLSKYQKTVTQSSVNMKSASVAEQINVTNISNNLKITSIDALIKASKTT